MERRDFLKLVGLSVVYPWLPKPAETIMLCDLPKRVLDALSDEELGDDVVYFQGKRVIFPDKLWSQNEIFFRGVKLTYIKGL